MTEDVAQSSVLNILPFLEMPVMTLRADYAASHARARGPDLPTAKKILSLPSGVTWAWTHDTGEWPGGVRKATTTWFFLMEKQVRHPSSVPYTAFCGFPLDSLRRAKVEGWRLLTLCGTTL